MNSMNIDLMGIYVPTIGVVGVLAIILTVILGQLLDRFNVFSFFWHRGFVEASIFVMLFSGGLMLAFSLD